MTMHNVGTNGGAYPLQDRESMFTHFQIFLKQPAYPVRRI